MIKYPKTPYLPFSPTIDVDDPTINPNVFLGNTVVISIKMDGSNTALTKEKVYGRSLHHPSFNKIKQIHGNINHLIPKHKHIFGESLVAKHSIHYKDEIALTDLFQVFAVYDESKNQFDSFSTVESIANEIGLTVVKSFEFNFCNLDDLQKVAMKVFNEVVEEGHEGIVIRNEKSFDYNDFATNVGKMVRANHVQSKIHWTRDKIILNQTKNML